MNVIAFTASPREDGNTDLVIREVVRILEARGIKTELVRLHDKNIQPCTACDFCESAEACTIEDDLFELYLKAKEKRDEANMSGYKSALDLIAKAIELDPEFAVAWAYKANIHHLLNVFGPYSSAIAEADAGIRAAEKAIELEPNLADGYIYLGYIKAFKSEWIDAEQNIRKALNVVGESLSFDHVFIIPFYLNVGKFKRAHELLEEMGETILLIKHFGGGIIILTAYLVIGSEPKRYINVETNCC